MRRTGWPPPASTKTTNKSVALILEELLESSAARLSVLSNTPQLDVQVLLAHVVQKPRTWVLAHGRTSLNHEKAFVFEGLMQRLEGGEPLPYILGHWEFFGLDFDLTQDVLIPRPETEVLTAGAIAWLRQHPIDAGLPISVPGQVVLRLPSHSTWLLPTYLLPTSPIAH